MKKSLLIILLTTGISNLSAQTTSIPDPAFEEALIDMNIDSDGQINGQVLTSNITSVTQLNLDATVYGSLFNLTDLTGLQDFTNLQRLSIYFTQITTLDISQNTQLKSLTCRNSMLTAIDLSTNLLLEELNLGNVSDLEPHNPITEIDLSHNPAIKKIHAEDSSITHINLKNNNNNPDMLIDIGFYPFMPNPEDEGEIFRTVCIEVDDAELALSHQLPYSEWDILYSYAQYNYTENCTLSNPHPNKTIVLLHPNPTSDILHSQSTNSTIISKASIFDLSGRLIKQYNDINPSISISELQAGTYIIKLIAGKETFTQKIIKK